MSTPHPNAPDDRPMGPFLTIWTGQIFSLLGSQLVQFALIWYLTQRTGSATVLAMATLAAILPQVILGPFAGALVDRWNRRAVMIIADAAIALAVVVLAILFALDAAQVWHIYALMFLRAAGAAFHWPAMQASTSLMVPEKHLSRIAGLNQSLWGVASIVSPPVGALLLGVLPMQGILAMDVITALIAITPLMFIAVPQPPRAESAEVVPPTSMLADLGAGLRFAWGWPGLMMVGAIAALLNMLLNPAFALLPILVTDHFRGGAIQLAWLESAMGIGVVLGGLALGAWGGFKRRAITALTALVLMGVGITAVGLMPPTGFSLTVGALFLMGFMNPICNGALFAALQATVPADMQGRIFTLLLSFCGIMSPLGLAMAGPLADALGVQAWFLAGGLLTLTLGVGALFVPAIVNLEEWKGPGSEAETLAMPRAAAEAVSMD